jgi:hypothetical protein
MDTDGHRFNRRNRTQRTQSILDCGGKRSATPLCGGIEHGALSKSAIAAALCRRTAMSSVKAGVALWAGFCFLLKAVLVFFPFRRSRVQNVFLARPTALAVALPAIRARPRRDGTS